ncbi:hypothetical protein IQ07DRAFT_595326 [Pyrenochaeta sp. DS3sAY3a]|nr:hypothetical protein IQ07DRAFT_595326 [Pyrenochaeta sp. DS3sAY3a]
MAMFGTRVRFMQCHAVQIGYFRPVEKGRGEIMFHAALVVCQGPARCLVKLRINSPRHLLDDTDHCILSFDTAEHGTALWHPSLAQTLSFAVVESAAVEMAPSNAALHVALRPLSVGWPSRAVPVSPVCDDAVAGPFPVLDTSESSVLLYGRRGITIRHRD